jgi:hypothetical protein
MSHFYASIQGNRGEATRQGTKNSGMYGHVRGWDIGGRVHCFVRDGEDCIQITVTRGSNGYGSEKFLGNFIIKDGEIVRVGGDS